MTRDPHYHCREAGCDELLVPTKSGFTCPKLHGKLVMDRTLTTRTIASYARRLQRQKQNEADRANKDAERAEWIASLPIAVPVNPEAKIARLLRVGERTLIRATPLTVGSYDGPRGRKCYMDVWLTRKPRVGERFVGKNSCEVVLLNGEPVFAKEREAK